MKIIELNIYLASSKYYYYSKYLKMIKSESLLTKGWFLFICHLQVVSHGTIKLDPMDCPTGDRAWYEQFSVKWVRSTFNQQDSVKIRWNFGQLTWADSVNNIRWTDFGQIRQNFLSLVTNFRNWYNV